MLFVTAYTLYFRDNCTEIYEMVRKRFVAKKANRKGQRTITIVSINLGISQFKIS